MVRRLHAAGIEVILDVVYNHTAETDEFGPTLSWRGLDNASYYRLPEGERCTTRTTPAAATRSNLSHPRVLQMVMDSLRYWVREMHVDGFRFDLATVLGRGRDGFDRQAAFFACVAQDPVLAGVKLIAEPWDIGPGGYQLGQFPPRWVEWNDRFRDSDARLLAGAAIARRGEFARRLCASADLFHQRGRAPSASVNFVVVARRLHAARPGQLRRSAQPGQRRGQPRRPRPQPELELRRRRPDRRPGGAGAARSRCSARCWPRCCCRRARRCWPPATNSATARAATTTPTARTTRSPGSTGHAPTIGLIDFAPRLIALRRAPAAAWPTRWYADGRRRTDLAAAQTASRCRAQRLARPCGAGHRRAHRSAGPPDAAAAAAGQCRRPRARLPTAARALAGAARQQLAARRARAGRPSMRRRCTCRHAAWCCCSRLRTEAMRFPRASGVLLHPTSLPGPHGSGDFGPRPTTSSTGWSRPGRRCGRSCRSTGIGPGNSPYPAVRPSPATRCWSTCRSCSRQGWLGAAEIQPDPGAARAARRLCRVQPLRMQRLALAAQRFLALPAQDERQRVRAVLPAPCRLARRLRAVHGAERGATTSRAGATGRRRWPGANPARWRRPPRSTPSASPSGSSASGASSASGSRSRPTPTSAASRIIGDMPIFVATDSADVWAHPDLFELDADGRADASSPACRPTTSAPPASAGAIRSTAGTRMARDGYAWWVARMRARPRAGRHRPHRPLPRLRRLLGDPGRRADRRSTAAGAAAPAPPCSRPSTPRSGRAADHRRGPGHDHARRRRAAPTLRSFPA